MVYNLKRDWKEILKLRTNEFSLSSSLFTGLQKTCFRLLQAVKIKVYSKVIRKFATFEKIFSHWNNLKGVIVASIRVITCILFLLEQNLLNYDISWRCKWRELYGWFVGCDCLGVWLRVDQAAVFIPIPVVWWQCSIIAIRVHVLFFVVRNALLFFSCSCIIY